MKKTSRFLLCSLLVFYFFGFTAEISAATEYVTFSSFYKESSYLSWWIAGAVALASGAVIFFTGGTGSPIVVSMGTWVGGMMGLSGAAATNAGLALLGGGSLAAGGFGILGGTAVLTAALTFGTEVAFDYTVGNAMSAYSYKKLQKESENMLTLPIPVNEEGTEDHEGALEILEGIETSGGEFLLSEQDKLIISEAIEYLLEFEYSPDRFQKVRQDSLLAILYFILGDYEAANGFSANALIDGVDLESTKDTVPRFIYSVSLMYFEDFDYEESADFFVGAILDEPKNPLIPLLFAIYLDRMMLRFNDGYLDYHSLIPVFDLMQDELIDRYRVPNYTNLLTRLFVRLWLEQQKILNITASTDIELKSNSRTIRLVEKAMASYTGLLDLSADVLAGFFDEKLDEDARAQVKVFVQLLLEYTREEARLNGMVQNMVEQAEV